MRRRFLTGSVRSAVLPTFSLTEQNAAVVAQVCRRLDGLPLAIELAAARVKLLRVEQIAARLDNRFRLLTAGNRTALPRHQTLEALIDWSYDLLTPAEQRLLRWLSVFAQGWTLEAVEIVCSHISPESGAAGRPATAAEDNGDVLERLAQLVNKSLVVAERESGQETRYHLLETIRQYAWAKLVAIGEAETAQAQHLAYFLQLAETAEAELHHANQILWLERLETERDNFRAAFVWSLENENGDLESGLRLATALADFWKMRSHWQEARRWLGVAMGKRIAATPPIRARFILNAIWLWLEDRKSDAMSLLEESLMLYRQLNDKRGVARSLLEQGWQARNINGDLHAASFLFSESLTQARQIGDISLLTQAYWGLSRLAVYQGDEVQAAELCARGLDLIRETGDKWLKLRFLFVLGRNAKQQQRDYARAATFFQESLTLCRELKDKLYEANCLNALGEMARFQKAYAQAALYYHDSLVLRREIGSSQIIDSLHNLALVALGQGNLPQARSLFDESMVLAKETKDKDSCVMNIWGVGRIALAEASSPTFFCQQPGVGKSSRSR